MSSGHRQDGAASVSNVVSMIQREPGLQNYLARRSETMIISRMFLCPYGAGASRDGIMTYVDEGIPLRFKMGVEPDKFVHGHEGFEWWLMTRRDKKYWQGPSAKSAHWWATGYEHFLMKMDGYSDEEIAEYEAEWLTYISEDESQRISVETVPPDLYTGPYEAGMDSDQSEDDLDEKILPILLAARSRSLEVRQARLGTLQDQ